MIRPALVLIAVLELAGSAWAQRAPNSQAKPEPSQPHNDSQQPRQTAPIVATIWVGQKVPDFRLYASNGRQVRMSEMRGDWIVLVFADRARDVSPLRKTEDEIRSLGARIVAVTHEKTSSLRSVAKKDTLSLELLSDVTGQVSASYGMFDYERGEIRQGFMIVDRGGIVRLMLAGPLPPPDALARLTEFSITGI